MVDDEQERYNMDDGRKTTMRWYARWALFETKHGEDHGGLKDDGGIK